VTGAARGGSLSFSSPDGRISRCAGTGTDSRVYRVYCYRAVRTSNGTLLQDFSDTKERTQSRNSYGHRVARLTETWVYFRSAFPIVLAYPYFEPLIPARNLYCPATRIQLKRAKCVNKSSPTADYFVLSGQ